MPKRITLALTALLTLLLFAPPARAGTYTVYSCKTPSGRWVGSEGWSRVNGPLTVGYDSGSFVDCDASAEPMELGLGDLNLVAFPGSYIGVSFSAPVGTTIANFQMYRAFRLGWPVDAGADRPYALHAWHGDSPSSRIVDFQVPVRRGGTATLLVPALVERGNASWGDVRIGLTCWTLSGTGDCGGFASSVTITRFMVVLSDERSPSVVATCCDARLRGVTEIGYSAQDVGGGVRHVRLEIDARTAAEQVVDENSGRCEDIEPDNGDEHEFVFPQPCALTADGEISYDSSNLRDGLHTVRITVDDAAGNRSAAVERTVTTHNAPVPNGTPQILGEEQVDSTLSVDPGQWDGDVTGYGYRWLRCDGAGDGCVGVPGADGVEYRPGTADAYHRLVVEVTAGNASGTAVARTAASGVIADAAGNTSAPGPGRGEEEPKPGAGGGGERAGGGGGAAGGTGSGGVAGIPSLQNPLGEQPGRAANGSGATAKVKFTLGLRRAGGGTVRRVLGPRGRRWTVTGRLLNGAGRPIGGARINLLNRVSGRRWVARRGFVRTRADGRFSVTLPGGPSRTVRATYFPFGDSDAFRASNAVAIDVLAPLTIRTDRGVVSGRRIVTIRGSAGGGSIPRGGLLVTLQGFQAGFGWRTFRTLRTDARGRWRASYRFRATTGRFAFRALVPHQGTYPYATTVSRSVAVTVR